MAAHQLLDQAQTLARLAALSPAAYVDALAAEVPAGETREAAAARDEQVRDALARIDALAERAMRLGLEQALVDDAALGAPTRKVFAATVIGYADRLELLADRARAVAERGGARDPDAIAARVVDAAARALALRAELRAGVLALVAGLAAASAAAADRSARDRRLDEPTRAGWSALRRELAAIAAEPARVTTAPFAVRVASWPAQLDEPDPATEPKVVDLIELD